ncbi:adhesion G-protein coupled receptor F1 [Sorex araneus]|uniref:adhesion G-protein coupled receptor F1 n=1 Tax=Sorex araneus TaxID=42254 RepID=UPI00243338E2|nr:adhesion G-protein coupled receptor F1 [Sorex araneus]
MRAPMLWLITFFTITEDSEGFLGRNISLRLKREFIMNKKKHPGPAREYELLLQVTYRDSKEKKDLMNFLKLLKPPSLCLHGSMKVIRAKATTYCGNQDGVLQCACEDGYTWFPISCLDPQKCSFHTTGSHQSCTCQLNNLTQSVNFCERAKVWGTFKINERFTKNLLNSSSAIYFKYKTGIETKLKEVYNRIQGFESVRVSQFRGDSSISAGYEVVGSTSTSELLSAIEQVAEEAKEALHKLFPLEADSFQVFRKAQCNSIVFGFGSQNDEYTLPCSSGYTGIITVTCQPSGWQIIKETCVLSQLEELKENFSVIAGTVTEAAMSSLVRNLSVVIQQSPATTAGDLASVVSILGNVSSLSMASLLNVSNTTMEDIINIADHILNSTSVTNWTVLLQEEKYASSQLLETLENISILVHPTALPLNFSRKFINWKGIPVTESQFREGYSYQTEVYKNTSAPIRGHVLIGSDQFQRSRPTSIISMASLTLGDILPITQIGNVQVNGPVISTIIQNFSINEVFLSFSKIQSNLSQPHCVFWDFSHLKWNSAGCHFVNETQDTVLCRCTHLTSFSILMSPFVPPAIIPAVKWITFIGLGISIGSLLLCLILEAVFWKQFKKSQTSYTRHICMVNIALCLLIADLWFIVAVTVDITATPAGVCIAAVFFTHLFYLSSFFWMLMLGILLAYRIVLVFHHLAMPWMMAAGFCLGYACPLLIAVITIAVTQPSNEYRSKDACWLNWSEESKPLLAFAAPVLTIVAVNLAVVLLVLTKLWRPAVGEKLSQDDRATVIRMGKSLLILTPLLGLTWGFGIGTMVDSQNLAWHVIFALLNAFQGFFILCFGMLLDNKLRQLLFNKLSPLSSLKQSSKQNSSDLSDNSKFTKPFKPLQHKGAYAFSHTGDSMNDIILTQFLSSE